MATDQHDQVTTRIPTEPFMGMVAINLIEESLTNPRKSFNAEKLAELAESIRISGVHQPILLRPLPGSRVPDTWGFRRKEAPLPVYELVAGARRFRASKLAQVAEIPAMVRDLTDDQALEIQLIENLQREDMTELEEAEGYRALMEHSNLTAEQVAEKIGKGDQKNKGKSYVYARLKLLDLHSDARKALLDGAIDISRALRIARIPDGKLQAKALAAASEKIHTGDYKMGVREFELWLRQNVMLRMEKARFDIASTTLCPDAGACTSCHKRTGANPDLFTEASGADLCTDTACYRAKEEAHDAAAVEAAKKLGSKVISGAEARELMPHDNSQSYGAATIKGYVDLDGSSYSIGVFNSTVRKALGKDCPEPTVLINPHTGKPMQVVKESTARRIIKQRREDLEAKAGAKQEAALLSVPVEKRPAYRTRWHDQAADTVANKFTGQKNYVLPAEALRVILGEALHNWDEGCMAQALGLPSEFNISEAEEKLDATPDDELNALYARWLVYEAMDRVYSSTDIMGATAPRHMLCILADAVGVDIRAVQADVKRAMESEDRAAEIEREAEKAAAPKTASTPPPAAQATPTRAKSKAQKPPAAQAGDTAPKTSKEHASAQIAEALAALDEKDQAPAAQGDEAPAVPVGQPVATAPDPISAWPFPTSPAKVASQRADRAVPKPKGKAPAAQGNDAQPVATAQAAAAPAGQAGGDVGNGAATNPVAVAVGLRVLVNDTATGKNQKPWIGYEGKVTGKAGSTAWIVDIERSKRSAPKAVVFDATELEVVNA